MFVLTQNTTVAGEFPGEIERHDPREPRGVAGVRLDRLPSAVGSSRSIAGGFSRTPAVAAA